MSDRENILKKGHIGTHWEMHVNGDIRRQDSKKITFTKARGPQGCLHLPLVPHQLKVQTMGKIAFLFPPHIVFLESC